MKRFLRLDGFLTLDQGAAAVEYCLMAAAIAGAVVITVQLFGGSVLALFANFVDILPF